MAFPVRLSYVIYFFMGLILLTLVSLQFVLPDPFTWWHWIIVIFTLLLFYFVINWNQFYGWVKIGKINFTFVFIDQEVKRKFVVYTTNENNINVVVQNISASIRPQVLAECIGPNAQTVDVVNPDGSRINVFNCGDVLTKQLTFMVNLYNWENLTLHLGIVNEERIRVNQDEPIMTSYLLLDAEDSISEINYRNINNYNNIRYIFGQSDEKKISLKIKEREYSDVSIYMHIFNSSVASKYENCLAFGVLGDNNLVDSRWISSGDNVYLKMSDR